MNTPNVARDPRSHTQIGIRRSSRARGPRPQAFAVRRTCRERRTARTICSPSSTPGSTSAPSSRKKRSRIHWSSSKDTTHFFGAFNTVDMYPPQVDGDGLRILQQYAPADTVRRFGGGEAHVGEAPVVRDDGTWGFARRNRRD